LKAYQKISIFKTQFYQKCNENMELRRVGQETAADRNAAQIHPNVRTMEDENTSSTHVVKKDEEFVYAAEKAAGHGGLFLSESIRHAVGAYRTQTR